MVTVGPALSTRDIQAQEKQNVILIDKHFKVQKTSF